MHTRAAKRPPDTPATVVYARNGVCVRGKGAILSKSLVQRVVSHHHIVTLTWRRYDWQPRPKRCSEGSAPNPMFDTTTHNFVLLLLILCCVIMRGAWCLLNTTNMMWVCGYKSEKAERCMKFCKDPNPLLRPSWEHSRMRATFFQRKNQFGRLGGGSSTLSNNT